MVKNLLIAAGVAVALCSAAQASGSALEALTGSVNANVNVEAPAVGAAPESERGGDRVYANADGCTVTVVRGEYGSTLAVRDGRQEAVLGVANDFSRGDIRSYCSPAAVARNGAVLSLSCGKQDNGFFRTRGRAEVEMSGEGVTSVKVRGEVRRALVWFTDKEITCGGLKPAGGVTAAAGLDKAAAAQTSIDGWLDEKHHDHIAKDPNGSGLNTVLYVTLVKSDDKLYLQAFLPGHGSYLADFITSPAFAREDLAALRSDQGHPYLVAFETYATTVPKTNMLVVQFNGAGMLRFAIVQKFPTSEIKGGKFKPYVPSDSDRKAWSPWTAVK
ncbi:MAG: hypothetical protein A2X35_03955 [Elusimicrobia bacterium GWA2_61_42]|nr:MAG: hypothetical protein A2X35_03955 [Elusimicrobia bacterium GWA2_61_42]OGR76734.1 MAG: hypothetical protein A2X38_12830 [Elusimicrobia bacterium GWC2_61_25]